MSTPENNHRIDYIEFATRDIAAARNFYTAAFGWKFTDYGPDYTSFEDGRIAGGFYHPTIVGGNAADIPARSQPMVVIYATKLEDAEQRVTRAGGKILKPSFEFPGGRRFEYSDPTGVVLAVWSDTRADGTKIA
jgi:uncharacterized protein